ncbi:hypothetical protein ABIE13_000067 [Ottowia thiooxydans]|uniref:Uncharacterized protein n=1 Tax=Ottowia thiooxydans TaxID=219182 RepID=A0ABV2Q1R8_9BURK
MDAGNDGWRVVPVPVLASMVVLWLACMGQSLSKMLHEFFIA